MNAKRSLYYFSTNYVDRSLLCIELAATMPVKKIFINEVLSPSKPANYNSLKEVAMKIALSLEPVNSAIPISLPVTRNDGTEGGGAR